MNVSAPPSPAGVIMRMEINSGHLEEGNSAGTAQSLWSCQLFQVLNQPLFFQGRAWIYAGLLREKETELHVDCDRKGSAQQSQWEPRVPSVTERSPGAPTDLAQI